MKFFKNEADSPQYDTLKAELEAAGVIVLKDDFS